MILAQRPEIKLFSANFLREQIKQELRQSIHEALKAAESLPPDVCLQEIRTRLIAIQKYCETRQKTFIMVEEAITCDRYELGGGWQNAATLFRGPNKDASVAICVTHQGSLLHRSGCPWRIYRNAGDVAIESTTPPVLHSEP